MTATKQERIERARLYAPRLIEALDKYDLMVVKSANSNLNLGLAPEMALIVALLDTGVLK